MKAKVVDELAMLMGVSEGEVLEAIRKVRLRPRVPGLRFEGRG